MDNEECNRVNQVVNHKRPMDNEECNRVNQVVNHKRPMDNEEYNIIRCHYDVVEYKT